MTRTTPSRTVLALGAGLAVTVLAAAVGTLAVPSTTATPPRVVPVVSTQLVCPDGTADLHAGTQVFAVTPSRLATGVGTAAVGTVGRPTSLGTISGPTHSATYDAPRGSNAVVGTAVAGRAPGFAMGQLTISTRRSDHGLAGTPCTEPTNDAWFVGSVSTVGHQSQLFLTDPESTDATVDVDVFDGNGTVSAPSVQGLVVPAESRRVVELDQVAPSSGAIAVHVTVLAGRVGAAVRDSQVDGLIPQGADWLPAAAAPATTVVVPGLGAGQGRRTLSVYAPGEGTATLNVTVVGQQDSFTPTGGASVEVDRGKVTTIDLGAAAAGDQTGVVVRSDVPVVAGVRWLVTSSRVSDLAFSAGATALTAPAVFAGAQADGGYGTALMLTAPAAAARVSVQLLVGGLPHGAPLVVAVGAARTVRTELGRGISGPFQLVVTPVAGGGPVYGAVVRTHAVDGAAGTTVALLEDTRVDVAAPHARPNLDVGLG